MVHVIVKASPPESLSVLRDVPGVKYRDEIVSLAAKDLEEAGRGIKALAEIATQPFQQFLSHQVEKQSNAVELQRYALEEMIQRYGDSKEGRWTPPPPANHTPRAMANTIGIDESTRRCHRQGKNAQ